MKKLSLVLVVVVLVVGLTGCGKKSESLPEVVTENVTVTENI